MMQNIVCISFFELSESKKKTTLKKTEGENKKHGGVISIVGRGRVSM